MARPDIKGGDILKYTEAWFEWISGDTKVTDKHTRFIATGRITGEEPDYLIAVVKVNGSYVHKYHHSFLEKV